eukprot:3567157-Rhodomonas_salina.2
MRRGAECGLTGVGDLVEDWEGAVENLLPGLAAGHFVVQVELARLCQLFRVPFLRARCKRVDSGLNMRERWVFCVWRRLQFVEERVRSIPELFLFLFRWSSWFEG